MESALSFRFRLVAYFVFLSLLPLSAATWAFGGSAAENETHGVDARLANDLRSSVSALDQALDERAGALEPPRRGRARPRGVRRARPRSARPAGRCDAWDDVLPAREARRRPA